MTTFDYFGRNFDLFDHPYNTTRLNERAVEIPVALDFVDDRPGRGLEVGNVLGYYRPGRRWRVVDRHERAPGVDNLDVFNIEGRYDWIVSVSTLEHVRKDDTVKNPTGAIAALIYLFGLVASTGHMLITVGLGQNQDLDEFLLDIGRTAPPHRAATLVRAGDGWIQTETPTFKPYRLTTKWAESVWIGEW